MDGHLGYFHVLAIVNSAVINIGVHVLFYFFFSTLFFFILFFLICSEFCHTLK